MVSSQTRNALWWVPCSLLGISPLKMSICLWLMDALHLCILWNNRAWHTPFTNEQQCGWVAIMYMHNMGIFANIVSKFSNYSTHRLQKVLLRGHVVDYMELLYAGCMFCWLQWLKHMSPPTPPWNTSHHVFVRHKVIHYRHSNLRTTYAGFVVYL